MNQSLSELFVNNRNWAAKKISENPRFFIDGAKGQNPPYLWIGCADSRVPANEVTGTKPGEVFVHRNVANMVVSGDLSILSTLEYAVNVLGIKEVIVCGHYGCGGVLTAMKNSTVGIIDNWLRNIKDVYNKHKEELESIPEGVDREKRFVELNVEEQVKNLCKTSIIQSAWDRGVPVNVHGIVYDLEKGLLKDLDVTISDRSSLEKIYALKHSIPA